MSTTSAYASRRNRALNYKLGRPEDTLPGAFTPRELILAAVLEIDEIVAAMLEPGHNDNILGIAHLVLTYDPKQPCRYDLNSLVEDALSATAPVWLRVEVMWDALAETDDDKFEASIRAKAAAR